MTLPAIENRRSLDATLEVLVFKKDLWGLDRDKKEAQAVRPALPEKGWRDGEITPRSLRRSG